MLAYSEHGEGPPIVLVHGFPLDNTVFENQLNDLSGKYRVITPDLLGFGKSGPPKPFTMESMADELRTFLAKIDALPCVLGGLSMGGYVSLAFSRKYASDLRGLILIDTRAEGDTPEGKAARNEMIELARTLGSSAVAKKMMPKMLDGQMATRNPAVVTRLMKIMQSCPAETIQYALAAMRDRPDFTSDLPLMRKPVLVIVGHGDALTTPAMSQKMHEAIPGSKLIKISDAGHMSPMENPAGVSSAISEFVGSRCAF
jgi:pimeloyl-ACP methyl ester carboxylesterase